MAQANGEEQGSRTGAMYQADELGEQRPQDVVDKLFSFIYDQDQPDDGLLSDSEEEDSVEVPQYHGGTWAHDNEDEHIYQNLTKLDTMKDMGHTDDEPVCKKARPSLDARGIGQSIDSGMVSNISCETLSPSSPTQTSQSTGNHTPLLQEAVKESNTSIIRVPSVTAIDYNPGSSVASTSLGEAGGMGMRVTTTSNVYVNCSSPGPNAAPAPTTTTTSIYLHADMPLHEYTSPIAGAREQPVNSIQTNINQGDGINTLPVDSSGPFDTNTELQMCPPVVSPSFTISINQEHASHDTSHLAVFPKETKDPFASQEQIYKADSVLEQLEEFEAKFPSFDEFANDKIPHSVTEVVYQKGRVEDKSNSAYSLGRQCNRDQPIVDIVAIQCEFVDTIDLNDEKCDIKETVSDTNIDTNTYIVLKNPRVNDKPASEMCSSDISSLKSKEFNTIGIGSEGQADKRVCELSPRAEDEETAASWQFVPTVKVVSDRYNQRQRRPASGPDHGDNNNGSQLAPVVPDVDNDPKGNDTRRQLPDINTITEGSTASDENAQVSETEDTGTLNESLCVGDLVRDSTCLVQAFNARFPSDPTRVTRNPIYDSCDTISPCDVSVYTSVDIITLNTYDPRRGNESTTDDGIITDSTPEGDYPASEGGTSVSLSLIGDTEESISSISSNDGRRPASSTDHGSRTDSSRSSSTASNDDGRSLTPYSSDEGIIRGTSPAACSSSSQCDDPACLTPTPESQATSPCYTTECSDSVCDDCVSCSCDEGISEDEEGASGGLGVAVSRAVRRSMRRMKRLRLSGRDRNSRRHYRDLDASSGLSQEAEVRRDLPDAPEVGLSTVRSPATASIMVTSLMASLAPTTNLETPISPRETLTPPSQDLNSSSRSRESSNGRSEGSRSGRRRRSRHHRSSRSRNTHQDSSTLNPLDTGPGDPSSGPLSLDSYYTGSSGPISTSTPVHSSLPSSPIPPSSPTHQAEDGRPSIHNSTFVALPSSSSTTSSSTTGIPTTTTSSTVSESPILTSQLTAGRQTSPIAEQSNTSLGASSTTTTTRGTGGTAIGRSGAPRPTNSSNSRDRRRHRRRDGSQPNDSNNNTQPSGGNSGTTNTNTNNTTTNNSNGARTAPRPPQRRNLSNGGLGHVTLEQERAHVQGGTWDHSHSSLMASLSVTVTTFNISRFAVLGAHFGWPFVAQWLLLSVVLGLPLMTFHMTVGQYLGAGVIDMWRISPIFQGVGFSVIIAQALLGVYCCVPTAWLFVYFRDSFITHNNKFRWADCQLVDCSPPNASLENLVIEGVPSYFNTKVLQRNETSDWMHELGSVKFDLAFNIGLIWIITLIALSKGNQSYGKVCYIVFLLPLLCYLVVCVYLTSWTDDLVINKNNSSFMDPMCWMAASREVFLVWGLHGAVLQQMATHNKKGHSLYRDTTVLTIITMLALILAAVMGSSCLAGIIEFDLYPKPSSFESIETSKFLSKTNQPFHSGFGSDINQIERKIYPVPEYAAIPTYSTAYDNFYTGIRIRPLKTTSSHVNILKGEQDLMGDRREPGVSGYQSIRVATELFPALLAINTAAKISPFWSSLFYLSLLLFGIAQQLAVWRTVVEAVIRINAERLQPWETFITFLCCLFGFSAALPMATGAGIHILYFLDYVVSCGWWLMIIQLVQLFAVLFVRGKPYSGQDIVSELMGGTANCRSLWQGPLTSFAWNIIVPVGLLVLSISSFKAGDYREVFAWSSSGYWKDWVCQLASAMQLFPILLVSLVGLIQTCRYLFKTEYDLFERIQLLYRPSLRQRINSGLLSSMYDAEDSDDEFVSRPTRIDVPVVPDSTPQPYSDPPPKYTPPPSYSTATGVRLAKLFNQGLRSSVRRLRNTLRPTTESESGRDGENTQERSNIQQEVTQPSNISTPYIPPPDYVSVVNERGTSNQTTITNSSDPPPLYATLDPLARQRALAALSGNNSSATEVKITDDVSASDITLHRNNSLRRSGLRRSLTSGVRRSARRLAATLGVGRGEADASLVNSEAPVSMDTNIGGANVDTEHPHAYTNFEMVLQSEA